LFFCIPGTISVFFNSFMPDTGIATLGAMADAAERERKLQEGRRRLERCVVRATAASAAPTPPLRARGAANERRPLFPHARALVRWQCLACVLTARPRRALSRLREKKGKKPAASSAARSADGAALLPTAAPAGHTVSKALSGAGVVPAAPRGGGGPPLAKQLPPHGTAGPDLGAGKASVRPLDSAAASVHGARGAEFGAAAPSTAQGRVDAVPQGEHAAPKPAGGNVHGTAAPEYAGGGQTSGGKTSMVNRWLEERDKRMRVVLAAALEMETAVAAASYAQSYFDPHVSSSGNSRGAKLHALLRSSHEVVQRLEVC